MTDLGKKKLPRKVRRRIDLANMFYPLERKEERRWGRLFKSEFSVIEQKFTELASEKRYRQTSLGDNVIIWRDDKNSDVECLLYFIRDVTDLKSVSRLFTLIEKYRPFCTYAIVHQKKDGENCYDIFRATPFSYLEHCNRVKYS